jgi:hypothetical protein
MGSRWDDNAKKYIDGQKGGVDFSRFATVKRTATILFLLLWLAPTQLV